MGQDERHRLTIEERAARRESLLHAGRDRYAALVRSLQAGRELPIGRPGGRRLRISVHPAFWTMLKIVAVAVAVYAIAVGAETLIRERRVDTWTGPDAAVTSGRTLAGCPDASRIRDDVFPSWLKIGETVYLLTDRRRPFSTVGGTRGFSDSGYRLGALRLLWIDDTEAGRAHQDAFVWQEGAIAGITYAIEPACR